MPVRTFACSVLLLLLAACGEISMSPIVPTAPSAAKGSSNTAQIVDGSFGPGALYRLFRPANWNGRLVIYAHGYTSLDQPVALPAEGALFIAALGAQGIAVAYSSFSENGWVVKDGAQRTHQLLGLFASNFGQPAKVYLGGASMGGLIAIKLTEKYPQTYSGTLAACAVSSGLTGQFAYNANTRVLFDFFYPGVLPGNAAYLPPGTDITTGIVGPALAAITTNPLPAFAMAQIDQTPFQWANPSELVQSILNSLGGNAQSLVELRSLTNDKPFFDNQSTIYSSASLPPALLLGINASVGRFASFPSAVNALTRDYTPSGDLRIPMLMLSNVRDAVVPGFNRASYLAAVTAAGNQNLLVQRTVPTFGHCVFSNADFLTAFNDLVAWAEYGIKPAP